ncbi:MAG: hypothetical protein WBW31_18155 [Candidatus Sulfotelmatobacter sp.]
MKKLPIGLLSFALLLLASAVLSCGTTSTALPCGTSPASSGANAGQLHSITLCPATADARDYADGQVQFTAIGFYVNPPSKVAPQPATWGACYQNTPTTEVSVSGNGLAQCGSGAAGTYTIFADDPTNCLSVGPCGTGCFVTGNAQLTCP